MKTTNLNDFGRRLSEIMPRMMFQIWVHEQNYFTTGRISFPQLWALGYLTHTSAATMRALAHTMRARESTTTGLVDRMSRMGLVRRVRSKKDRRVVYVEPTAKGRRVLDDINRQREETIKSLFKNLPGCDRTKYLEILEKILAEIPPPPPLHADKDIVS